MSKRAGNLVTLDEAIALIGADAARYALVRWSMDSPIDIDVDAVGRPDQRQPGLLRAVRARPAGLARSQRRELGVSLPPPAEIDYGLLAHEREGDLLRALGEFPRVVAAAAELRAPHRVARYLEELAGTYHRFYDACRVLPSGTRTRRGRTRARPAVAVRGDPDRAGQRPRPARRLRAGPDVT